MRVPLAPESQLIFLVSAFELIRNTKHGRAVRTFNNVVAGDGRNTRG